MNYNDPFFVAMLDSRVNMFRWTQCFMVDQFFLVQIKMAMRYSPISTGLCLDKKYIYHIFRYTVQPIMMVWYSCVFGIFFIATSNCKWFLSILYLDPWWWVMVMGFMMMGCIMMMMMIVSCYAIFVWVSQFNWLEYVASTHQRNAAPNGLNSLNPLPIGSMVLLYMVTWIPSIYPIHTPFMLAYIPAPAGSVMVLLMLLNSLPSGYLT